MTADSKRWAEPIAIGGNYAQFQLAKALRSASHAEGEALQHAKAKGQSWLKVLKNILAGTVQYGSRTPIASIPAWATLQVVTGGFATGELLAEGPLQSHEKSMLSRIGPVQPGTDRATLNAYFLSDTGLSELQEMLRSGHYEITLPEEGALLTVAWLASKWHLESARALLGVITPYFGRLRFYPVPAALPAKPHFGIYIHSAKDAVEQLLATKPSARLLAQREAIEIWAPFFDRMVALFFETERDGWPCQQYPRGWSTRADALATEYYRLRKLHTLCSKPDNLNKHFAQLRLALQRAASDPRALTGKEVGRIRTILQTCRNKRGAPSSERMMRTRERQALDVAKPSHHLFAKLVAVRAGGHTQGMTGNDIAAAIQPVTGEEAARHNLPLGATIPAPIARRIQRCLIGTAKELIENNVITSGDALANVLPQITSDLQAQALEDPQARALHGAIYRAFRRRRSLLLTSLQKQVQINELPWVAAIDEFRTQRGVRSVAKKGLNEFTSVVLTAFPHAILPNKLVGELKALVKCADLELPLVEELAADIFVGRFSDQFVHATRASAQLMTGSLYSTYYQIDYVDLLRRLGSTTARGPEAGEQVANRFAEICFARAGVLRRGNPASNGMVIEQQQILTTHNLAALFSAFDLSRSLEAELVPMAKNCFRWICRRQQSNPPNFHARLIMLKNTAYAWRQMIFFLSMQPWRLPEFLQWARVHLLQQPTAFRSRFEPAMLGLEMASMGRTPRISLDGSMSCRQFLGWSKDRHWLA